MDFLAGSGGKAEVAAAGGRAGAGSGGNWEKKNAWEGRDTRATREASEAYGADGGTEKRRETSRSSMLSDRRGSGTEEMGKETWGSEHPLRARAGADEEAIELKATRRGLWKKGSADPPKSLVQLLG